MCVTAMINLVVGGFDKRGNIEGGDLVDRRCRKIVPLAYFGVLVAIVLVFF